MGARDDALRFGDYRVRLLRQHERTPADFVAGREFCVVRVEGDEVLEKFRSLVSAESAARAMHEGRPRKSPVQEFREDAGAAAWFMGVMSAGCFLPWLLYAGIPMLLLVLLSLLDMPWRYVAGALLVICFVALVTRRR